MARKEEDFSEFVSQTLHTIGYKWDLIQWRREFKKNIYRIVSDRGRREDCLATAMAAGSSREGICPQFPLIGGGDADQMIIFDEVIATENVRLLENERNLTVLKLELNECPSGYSFLVVEKHGGRLPVKVGQERSQRALQIRLSSNCGLSYSGVSCLSSELFINSQYTSMINYVGIQKTPRSDGVLANMTNVQCRAGPSIPTFYDDGFAKLPVDNVPAIRCHCPSIFEKFRYRPRRHNWPPEDVLQELSQLEAHVVPVGCKRSVNAFLEWRICFTKAEIRLIECLTEPQIQVFILLKIFAKDVLKEVWYAMTSYIMKNVILWVVELTPGHRFRTDTIVDQFLACLFFLKVCIKAGRLPNYMIAERNLFSQDQFIVKKRQLLSTLDDCLREKGSCLLRSSRLKEAMTKMYSSPDLAIREGLERDLPERAMLYTVNLSRFGLFFDTSASMQDIARLFNFEEMARMLSLLRLATL